MSLASASSQKQKSLFFPILLVAFTISFLIGLGIWQLERLSWKQDLIAKIERRSKLPGTPMPAIQDWKDLRPEDYEYRHVEVLGDWARDKIALVFRATGGGTGIKLPGYLVFMPLKIKPASSNDTNSSFPSYIIVNRGFIPADQPDLAKTEPAGGWTDARIDGLMRSPEERNFFTPKDKPEDGQYFTRDPQLMAQQFNLANVAPFTIDQSFNAAAEAWPKGGTTEIAIPNNHLGYALTWFGLAFGCAGVFIAYIKAK